MAATSRARTAVAQVSAGNADSLGQVDVAVAEQLFDAVALLRRQTRRVAGRPWPVETLSGSQVDLVRVVRRHPGVSVAEAAAELGVAPNTVSTLVRQLTEAGLLVRVSDDHDRRIARLRLTAAAQRRVEVWRDRRATLVSAALDELPAASRAAIEKSIPVIAELAAVLRDQTESAVRSESPEGQHD